MNRHLSRTADWPPKISVGNVDTMFIHMAGALPVPILVWPNEATILERVKFVLFREFVSCLERGRKNGLNHLGLVSKLKKSSAADVSMKFVKLD